MKKAIKIIIYIMVSISLISTYVEYVNVKKRYIFVKEVYVDKTSVVSNSFVKRMNIEDILEEKMNWAFYSMNTYKQKIYWDCLIIIIFFGYIYLNKKQKE